MVSITGFSSFLGIITIPKNNKDLSGETLNSDQKREMREWASVNVAVVWQQSCRLEITMARAGTLPGNAYFEEHIAYLTPISSNQGIKVYEPRYITYLATSGSKRETTK